jgi:hypothetical protein
LKLFLCRNFKPSCLPPLLVMLIACAFLPTAGAQADIEKLRLLSCMEPQDNDSADAAEARDWVNGLPQPHQDEMLHLDGSAHLAGACVRDVRIGAAFGTMVVEGTVCNRSSAEFLAALASIGLKLDAISSAGCFEKTIQSKKANFAYRLGCADLIVSPPAKPSNAETLSFQCIRGSGNAQ